MKETTIGQKKRLLESARNGVNELIKVLDSKILGSEQDLDSDLAADKMKNAAAAKKLAMFDALEILNRIEEEEQTIKDIEEGDNDNSEIGGFAERRAK